MANILFICRYNRFRSKIAEAYYNSKSNTAKSAGFFPGIPLNENIMACARKLGLYLEATTQGISHDLVMWSDLIVIIDHVDSLPLFADYVENDDKKVIRWDIQDVEGDAVEERLRTAQRIIERIDEELLH
jgi:protein-tyrosine-phosphatase